MSKEKNYQNYRFKQDEVLNMSPVTLDRMNQFCDMVINKELTKLTPIKYDLVHNETGKLAPKKLSEAKRAEYRKIPNIQRTVESEALEYLTEEAKFAVQMQYMLHEVRVKNVDMGKGVDVVAEAEEKAKSNELENTKEPKLEVVNEES